MKPGKAASKRGFLLIEQPMTVATVSPQATPLPKILNEELQEVDGPILTPPNTTIGGIERFRRFSPPRKAHGLSP